MRNNNVSEKFKIQQLNLLVMENSFSQVELRRYLKTVEALIETLKPPKDIKPKVLWIEAVKTYLILTQDFYKLSTHSDPRVRAVTLSLAVEYPKFLPAEFCATQKIKDLLFKEKDASVRRALIRLIAKHCPEAEGTEILRQRVLLEPTSFVRAEILTALSPRVKTEKDLEFVLKRLEKLVWDDNTKKILLEIKPLANSQGLSILEERLRDQNANLTRLLPAAFLCGTWGLSALQKVIAIEAPSKEMITATIEGLKTLDALTWDPNIPVQYYSDLLNSPNSYVVQLAALVLQKGNKTTPESLSQMRTAQAREDLTPVAQREVSNIAIEITIDQIDGGLIHSNPLKRIEALQNITSRCERVTVSDFQIKRTLTQKAIRILQTDSSEIVRRSALITLKSPAIRKHARIPELQAIAPALKDSSPLVQRAAIEFFNSCKRLPPEIHAQVAAAEAQLTGDTTISELTVKSTKGMRADILNDLTSIQAQTPGVKAQLKTLVNEDPKTENRKKALTLVAENSLADDELKEFLFQVASRDISPPVIAHAVKLIGTYFPGDFSIFFKIIEAIQHKESEEQVRAFTGPLENWPIHSLRFDPPENQKSCEELIRILILDFQRFQLTMNRQVTGKWLQHLFVLAKDQLPQFTTIPWKTFFDLFSDKEYRTSLIRPVATLYALMPEATIEGLQESLNGNRCKQFYVDLIRGGNRHLTPDILKSSSRSITGSWIRAIRFGAANGCHKEFPKINTHIFLEYLKSNRTNRLLLKAILEEIDTLAPQIIESSDFYISNTLGEIARNTRLPIPIRKNAAEAVSRLQTKNRALKEEALDFASRLSQRPKPRKETMCANAIK